LDENGEIHFKTDSLSLFEFSLNSFSDTGLQMKNISLHLHRDGAREDLVMTEYETKFYGQGMPIYRLEAAIGEKAVERNRQRIAEELEEQSRRGGAKEPAPARDENRSAE
jgi:tRNA (guanine-N7-)-methyltransferase